MISDSIAKPLVGRHERLIVRSFPGARPLDTAVVNCVQQIRVNEYQGVILFLGGNALSNWKNRIGLSPNEVS